MNRYYQKKESLSRSKMSSVNQNSKFFILGLVVLATVIPAVWLMVKNQQPKPLISPLPASKTVANYKEEQKSISYYITTSQEFLNKARYLANSNDTSNDTGSKEIPDPNDTGSKEIHDPVSNPVSNSQTPEEKQKIIATINQALDLANQAIAFYSHDDRGFSQRANIYQALLPFLPESANFAIQDLKQAIKLNNQNPQYHSRLAELYLSVGNFENAALSFYNAYVLTPTEVQTLYNLADALAKSGQLQKAEHFFEKLISLLPPDDQNLAVIKNRQQQLKAMLTQARRPNDPGTGISFDPGSFMDLNTDKIIGTQELPLEQAALTKPIIIASVNDDTGSKEIHDPVSSAKVTTNAKTGRGVIPAGKTEVTIKNNHVANDKQIILVPISDAENKVLFLKAKKAYEAYPYDTGSKEIHDPVSNSSNTPGWFKAGIDKPISRDLEFNWWIVD